MESAGFEEGAADGGAWAAGSCLRGRRCSDGGTGPMNSVGASARRCRDSGGGGFLRSGSTPANRRRRRRRRTNRWRGAGWWRHAGEEATGCDFMGAGQRRPSRARLGRREAARRRRDAPGLRRVQVRHEVDGDARWACAAGSWLGWERAGTRAGPS
jgi:hypothetical protein